MFSPKRNRFKANSWKPLMSSQPSFYKAGYLCTSSSFSWWQWNSRVKKKAKKAIHSASELDLLSSAPLSQLNFVNEMAPQETEQSNSVIPQKELSPE